MALAGARLRSLRLHLAPTSVTAGMEVVTVDSALESLLPSLMHVTRLELMGAGVGGRPDPWVACTLRRMPLTGLLIPLWLACASCWCPRLPHTGAKAATAE